MKLKINDEDCLAIFNEQDEEIIHIEYDYTMEDVVAEITKLVKYINKN